MSVAPPTRVVVVGGGPAGCAAAIAMASAGIPVTLVERALFPRVKTCGEFISPAATALLERLIPADRLRAIGGTRVDAMVLERGDRTLRVPLRCGAWAVARSALDSELLALARSAGAEVMQPAAVLAVNYGADRVVVRLASGDSIECSVVVHADGVGRHDPRGPVTMARGWIGLKCHVRRSFDAVRMRACRGAYVGAIGLGGGLGTVAIAARAGLLLSHGGDHDSLVRSLWPEYEPSWRDGAWATCGIARSRYVPPGHPRSMRIGNAGAAVDPIGGEGIGLALWSGDLLGQMMTRPGTRGVSELRALQRRFAVAYRRRLRWRRPACRVAADVFSRPGPTSAFWSMVGARTAIVRAWSGASGKAGTHGAT